MRENSQESFLLIFAVVAAIFGLILVSIMLVEPTIGYGGNFALTQPIIGSLYISICLLGVGAVFFPQKCQQTITFGKHPQSAEAQTFASKKVKLIGHHPDCTKFSANRIKIGNSIICAACSGLLAGAVLSSVGAIFYFFLRYSFLWLDPRILLVSDAGLLLGIFQFRFAGFVKLFVNGFFVVCSLVTLVVADLLRKSLFINLYVLGLIVFMLVVRILFSEWNNKRTCSKCVLCV